MNEPEVEELFFQMLQIAVGKEVDTKLVLSDEKWQAIYKMASEQSVLGVVLHAADILSKTGHKPPIRLTLKWIGEGEQIRHRNGRVDQQCVQLTSWFKQHGFSNSIIKGQGVARLYYQPDLRQSGDIDIWVDGNRDVIVKTMRDNFIGVTYVDYVNCHAAFFTDTEVEVHFRPTWFFNPIVNSRVQRWIRKNKVKQMTHHDEQVGFNNPTIEFNLVFSLIHIFRHVLFEGIGLRQMTDYFFILQHSTEVERKKALTVLKSFGVSKFVEAVMYVMHRVFGMDSYLLMCEPNERQGEILLGEILRGGNFGKHDGRIKRVKDNQRWKRGWENLKRDMKYVKDYPSEVLWMPAWKVWHYFWRMLHGYLD